VKKLKEIELFITLIQDVFDKHILGTVDSPSQSIQIRNQMVRQ